ncbi:PQQ-dependent sugar dehydrogenase [Actinomadura terrae]|uniref:PQQ-dependent sugar dehydrogenase n=1 Tax=Actinomadura terrae TaxID=604353 RepID=UPI001FA71E3D|nr:PQQ-dependent sugar dehydrogenase [Actinomadura terrae]
MRRHAITLTSALAAACALLAGCSSSDDDEPESKPSTRRPPAASTGAARELVTGLSVPWAIAFLPGGDALVTERDSARLLRVTPAGKTTAVGKVPGVRPSGEGGLLGVAVSPGYARDHQIFLYYTAADDNRVVRATYDSRLDTPRPIVTGIPKGDNHNGGRLAFGPDGMLYVTTGESGAPEKSQERNSLGGKILRVTPDGRPAPGNPFGTPVWTWGHRNVQGLAWDERQRLYATEFGQIRFDEINRIVKGDNYGWPTVEGIGHRRGFTDPLVTWPTHQASPSGLAYANGSLWAAALQGTRLWQIPLRDGVPGRPVPRYQDAYGRLRAVVRAPDGTLWVTTSNKDGRGNPKSNDDRILVLPAR